MYSLPDTDARKIKDLRGRLVYSFAASTATGGTCRRPDGRTLHLEFPQACQKLAIVSGARYRILMLAFVALAGAATGARAGGVYKWIDKQGVTHYTNVPGDQQNARGTRIEAKPAESATRSSIYKFRDSSGITHYTDRKPRHANYVVISVYCPACDPRSTVNWNATRLNLTAYAAEVAAAALQYDVDPSLVRAIMHAESAFNPDARSRKGAQGLMQLMPATALQYGITNAFDASANIQGGVQHLAGLLKKYNGDVKLAAAAYNAGEGAVARYQGVPPYAETRVYVERVGILLKRYQDSAAVANLPAAAPALPAVQPALLNPTP